MKAISKLVTIPFLIVTIISFGQTDKCDTLYTHPDIFPTYKHGDSDLLKFLNKEIATIFVKCKKSNYELIDRIEFILTIDKKGKVIDVSFPKQDFNQLCIQDFKQKLLTMDGWNAGIMKGKPVCSTFDLPISCIKWEE